MSAGAKLPSYRTPVEHALALTDSIRMAFEIADEAARSDIECECACVTVDGVDWYCTDPHPYSSPEENAFVTRALAYFALRGGQMQQHPSEANLVRFARKN